LIESAVKQDIIWVTKRYPFNKGDDHMPVRQWLQKPWVRFTITTLIYFSIMLVLFYLYDYSGINQAKFIYNDF